MESILGQKLQSWLIMYHLGQRPSYINLKTPVRARKWNQYMFNFYCNFFLAFNKYLYL